MGTGDVAFCQEWVNGNVRGADSTDSTDSPGDDEIQIGGSGFGDGAQEIFDDVDDALG